MESEKKKKSPYKYGEKVDFNDDKKGSNLCPEPGCGKESIARCRSLATGCPEGHQWHIDKDDICKKGEELTIYFKDKLFRVASGYTPGGDVFPFYLVKYDEKNNSLKVVLDVFKKKGELFWFKFSSTTIVVHESKIDHVRR